MRFWTLDPVMLHERDQRLRRIRFAAIAKPWHDTGPLLSRSRDGTVRLARSSAAATSGDAERIDMPYPTAPPGGLTARRWTGRWPFARSRVVTLADIALAGFPILSLLLPYLLLATPDSLIHTGLIVGATCLFSASHIARQRLERDESIRIHARFWDRIIQTPLPPADADNLSDNAARRAFLLERGLKGALTLAAERRNLTAPLVVTAIATCLLWPDTILRPILMAAVILACGMAFLLERHLLALGERFASARHDVSRLERHPAFSMPTLRQLGTAPQRLRDLATRHQELAGMRYVLRLMQATAGTAPVVLAAAGVAMAWALRPSSEIDTLCGLFLLAPAIWCAADSGRRLSRLHNAWRRIEALRPLGLAQPARITQDTPFASIDNVRLEGIGFRHDPHTPPILTDFSLSISRGEIIALTGPSGSGKSTLLDILMGLRIPQAGQIIVNGSMREWQALSSYRARIAGVFQDTPIGLASIRGVIGQNAPTAREADILQAATDAGLARAIAALPMGMQSLVAEGGFPQSLGQQLLIARALAQRPDLLVLDETFSTLDRPVIETILAAIRRRGITLVFATHRADIAALADRTSFTADCAFPAAMPDLTDRSGDEPGG